MSSGSRGKNIFAPKMRCNSWRVYEMRCALNSVVTRIENTLGKLPLASTVNRRRRLSVTINTTPASSHLHRARRSLHCPSQVGRCENLCRTIGFCFINIDNVLCLEKLHAVQRFKTSKSDPYTLL